MFHTKSNFNARGPVSQVPASWFNKVASFLNNFVAGYGLTLNKSADGPSVISLDPKIVPQAVTHEVGTPEDKTDKETDEYLESLVKTVKDSGAVGINCSYKNVTEKMIKAFRDNGLLVSVWTVNDEKDMYKVLQLRPDNITTRHPDILGEIVK